MVAGCCRTVCDTGFGVLRRKRCSVYQRNGELDYYRIDRLAGLVLLLPLSVGQLVAAFGFTLSGPAAITVLFIATMVFVMLLAPRVGEFLNDVLSVPLSVGGIAYAIMQAKRR